LELREELLLDLQASIRMGMCAIRGAVVNTVEDENTSPRSITSSSSSSSVSSCSQELEVVDFEPAAAIWQRTIRKGRRCRPLSFSGLIIYDASGNQLEHSPRVPRESRKDLAELVD